MSVAVYSRLGGLLRARGLDAEDLRSRIVADTGLEVTTRVLDALADDGRVQRPDIEVAGAVATALSVGLDDLFDVRVIPDEDGTADHGGDNNGTDAGEWDPLDPEQSRRLDELRALRDERDLDQDESAELQSLIDEVGRAIIEHGILEIARTRGEPADRVRAEIMEASARSSATWNALQNDPALMTEAVREAKERRRVRGKAG